MILLSHEVKLKLQALVVANDAHKLTIMSSGSDLQAAKLLCKSDAQLHLAIDELIACLPPEVMEGL